MFTTTRKVLAMLFWQYILKNLGFFVVKNALFHIRFLKRQTISPAKPAGARRQDCTCSSSWTPSRTPWTRTPPSPHHCPGSPAHPATPEATVVRIVKKSELYKAWLLLWLWNKSDSLSRRPAHPATPEAKVVRIVKRSWTIWHHTVRISWARSEL